jgi:hypothetical protein
MMFEILYKYYKANINLGNQCKSDVFNLIF